MKHAPTGGGRGLHPPGQSTQMIVGADASSDRDILAMSTHLYQSYALRRVYYSAFSPIPDASSALPPAHAPLVREHRLYQADWLTRFYGFTAPEIETDRAGNLDLAMDPKLAWALAHRDQFPVDVNTALRERLLRVPGLGVKSVSAILRARRHRRLTLDDLVRLSGRLNPMSKFVVAQGHHPGKSLDSSGLRQLLAPKPKQADLFA